MFRSKEQQFDFYWKEIFDGLAYNPIEFNTYRFDQTMSLPGKVNKLYDMFKQLALNNQEVMDYLKEFMETFDFKLETTIKDILIVWLNEGLLADVVREAINDEVIEARTDYLGKKYVDLKERLDSEKAESLSKANEIEEDIVEVNTQLAEIATNVKNFGAKGDGVTDDTQAIKNALNNKTQTVFFPAGTYLVTETLTVPNGVSLEVASNTVIDGRGITTPTTTVIYSSGSVLATATLYKDVSVNSKEITVLSTDNIKVGDWILIKSTQDNSWSGFRTYRKQSFFQVRRIDGTLLTLNEETNTTFEVATTEIEILRPTTVKFHDFTLLVNSNNQAKGIVVEYGLNCLFDNITLIGGDVNGLNCSHSVRTSFKDCNVLLTAPATNYQYGIDVGSSDLTHIDNCYINSTRHAVAIVGNQCRRVRVTNSTLIGAFPPDAHGNADEYVYESCTIIGSNGLKMGGRNGTWRNCKFDCSNGTVIMAIEICGGDFLVENCEFVTQSTDVFGSGWSPIDLGRGTNSISVATREDMLFKFNNCKFTLPNLQGLNLIRLQNTSAYKLNIQMSNLIIDYPQMIGTLAYEGQPSGEDADFVIIDNITHNSTYTPFSYFKQGSNATGYATTKIKAPFSYNIDVWKTLPLDSGWVSNTASRTSFGYKVDRNTNKVILRGYLTGGSYGYPNYIFTLPEEIRPIKTHEIACATGSASGACKLTILNDGRVYATGGENELILDGVAYYLD